MSLKWPWRHEHRRLNASLSQAAERGAGGAARRRQSEAAPRGICRGNGPGVVRVGAHGDALASHHDVAIPILDVHIEISIGVLRNGKDEGVVRAAPIAVVLFEGDAERRVRDRQGQWARRRIRVFGEGLHKKPGPGDDSSRIVSAILPDTIRNMALVGAHGHLVKDAEVGIGLRTRSVGNVSRRNHDEECSLWRGGNCMGTHLDHAIEDVADNHY